MTFSVLCLKNGQIEYVGSVRQHHETRHRAGFFMPTRSPDRRGSAASRGYDATWRRLRAAHLAQHPLCRFCEQAGRVTLATVVDHIDPFKGRDDPRRLDPKNLASLCATHHNSTKQRVDKGGALVGNDRAGVPLDPKHHWHK